MKTYSIEIKFALILTAITILWTAGEKLLGFHDEMIALQPMVSMLILIPIVFIFYLCLREKRYTHYANQMTFQQGFTTAARFTIFTAILAPFSQLFISKVVTPDYFETAIRFTVRNGYMTQADAESNFNLSSYLAQATIGCLAMGLIIGLVMALICKTKKDN